MLLQPNKLDLNPILNLVKTDAQDFAPADDLEVALRGAAYANRTLILTMLNKAYAEEGGMLDLFLQSLREGDGTQQLIDHVLFVAMDQQAFRRCRSLGGGVKCYLLRAVDDDSGAGDLSSEQLYMSDGFIRMMWRRIRFLGDVLKHGYSFIFTVRTYVCDHACMHTYGHLHYCYCYMHH